MTTLQTSVAATGTATSASAATAAAATTATKSSTTAAGATDAAADRFLKLLVTQLRNQDPLNPLDNAQVTTQLAQLSTVSGINKLNDSVAALSASFAASQYLQATALVGHEVVVPTGGKIALAEGKATYGIALAAPATTVTVSIADAAGNVVRTIDLGAQPGGVNTLSWDGKNNAGAACADGTYTVSVKAAAGANAVSADPLTVSRVTGIVPGSSGTLLRLGNLGLADLTQLLQIN